MKKSVFSEYESPEIQLLGLYSEGCFASSEGGRLRDMEEADEYDFWANLNS